MEKKDTNSEGIKIYEVGYHLVPTLPEEGISAEADKIKAVITNLKGEIVSEAIPEMKTLAYSISKTVNSNKSTYSKAYFGWIKFSLEADVVEKVKTALDASEVVVRYLIVSTVKESTLIADKEKRSPRPDSSKEANEEEIDKTIDELVIN